MEISEARRSISQADMLRLLQEARQWLEQPAGLMLLQAECSAQRELLPNCFGQHLVQYGLAPGLLAPEVKVLRHCWHLDMLSQGESIAVDEACWPFAPQALDVVVLHHGLDFSLSPRALLREASQAVRAGGHLLIFGFNPISPARLVDWLELLGFAVEKRIDGCYRPPLESSTWLQRLDFMESLGQRRCLPGGGFYCLLARRQMLGITPQRERGRVFRR